MNSCFSIKLNLLKTSTALALFAVISVPVFAMTPDEIHSSNKVAKKPVGRREQTISEILKQGFSDATFNATINLNRANAQVEYLKSCYGRTPEFEKHYKAYEEYTALVLQDKKPVLNPSSKTPTVTNGDTTMVTTTSSHSSTLSTVDEIVIKQLQKAYNTLSNGDIQGAQDLYEMYFPMYENLHNKERIHQDPRINRHGHDLINLLKEMFGAAPQPLEVKSSTSGTAVTKSSVTVKSDSKQPETPTVTSELSKKPVVLPVLTIFEAEDLNRYFSDARLRVNFDVETADQMVEDLRKNYGHTIEFSTHDNNYKQYKADVIQSLNPSSKTPTVTSGTPMTITTTSHRPLPSVPPINLNKKDNKGELETVPNLSDKENGDSRTSMPPPAPSMDNYMKKHKKGFSKLDNISENMRTEKVLEANNQPEAKSSTSSTSAPPPAPSMDNYMKKYKKGAPRNGVANDIHENEKTSPQREVKSTDELLNNIAEIQRELTCALDLDSRRQKELEKNNLLLELNLDELQAKIDALNTDIAAKEKDLMALGKEKWQARALIKGDIKALETTKKGYIKIQGWRTDLEQRIEKEKADPEKTVNLLEAVGKNITKQDSQIYNIGSGIWDD